MIDIVEVVECTADTRKRLSEKTDVELIKLLLSIDKSIREGFEYAIYFQEWSVGLDILRLRGYEILSSNDLKDLAKNLDIQNVYI